MTLDELGRRLADAADAKAEADRRVALVPAGPGRAGLDQVAFDAAARLSFLETHLRLSTGFAYYLAENQWAGAGVTISTSERAALRAYRDTDLDAVAAAHNVARAAHPAPLR